MGCRSRCCRAPTFRRAAPRQLARVNRGRTPDVALLVFTQLCIGLALTGSCELIFILISTLDTAVTAITDPAYLQLRRREQALARPFRAIGHPVLPLLALTLDLGILLAGAVADVRCATDAMIAVA